MTRASAACRRLMTIPGRRSTDRARLCRRNRRSFAHPPIAGRRRLFRLGPQGGYRYGEVDYVGGISKCGDRRVRTLLYEAANVMLTRYKGQLKLKDWAFAIARRSKHARGARRSGASSRNHHARHAAGRNRVVAGVGPSDY